MFWIHIRPPSLLALVYMSFYRESGSKPLPAMCLLVELWILKSNIPHPPLMADIVIWLFILDAVEWLQNDCESAQSINGQEVVAHEGYHSTLRHSNHPMRAPMATRVLQQTCVAIDACMGMRGLVPWYDDILFISWIYDLAQAPTLVVCSHPYCHLSDTDVHKVCICTYIRHFLYINLFINMIYSVIIKEHWSLFYCLR